MQIHFKAKTQETNTAYSHIHTHTHTLSLSLSFCNYQSPNQPKQLHFSIKNTKDQYHITKLSERTQTIPEAQNIPQMEHTPI
jgi:hypothetical protein